MERVSWSFGQIPPSGKIERKSGSKCTRGENWEDQGGEVGGGGRKRTERDRKK